MVMVLTQIFLLMVLSSEVGALTWSNCDESSPVVIDEINVSPQPIQLKKGATINFSGKFKVTSVAGTQYQLSLSLQKKGWFSVWIPIPCPNIYCVQNVECSDIVDFLKGEQCPLPSKEYIVKDQSFALPDLPSVVTSLIPKGDYWLKVDLIDTASKNRVACVEAYPQITTKQQREDL